MQSEVKPLRFHCISPPCVFTGFRSQQVSEDTDPSDYGSAHGRSGSPSAAGSDAELRLVRRPDSQNSSDEDIAEPLGYVTVSPFRGPSKPAGGGGGGGDERARQARRIRLLSERLAVGLDEDDSADTAAAATGAA